MRSNEEKIKATGGQQTDERNRRRRDEIPERRRRERLADRKRRRAVVKDGGILAADPTHSCSRQELPGAAPSLTGLNQNSEPVQTSSVLTVVLKVCRRSVCTRVERAVHKDPGKKGCIVQRGRMPLLF